MYETLKIKKKIKNFTCSNLIAKLFRILKENFRTFGKIFYRLSGINDINGSMPHTAVVQNVLPSLLYKDGTREHWNSEVCHH